MDPKDHIRVELADGTQLQFVDYDELKDYCASELEFWQWLTTAARGIDHVRNLVNQVHSSLTQLMNLATQVV